MRLLHCEPRSLIGKTIVYRHQFWRVDDVADGHLVLSKHVREERGLLLVRLLRETRLYPTDTLVAARYPRLIQLLKETCLLTNTEAVSAIQGYLLNGGFDYGSEAIAHIGGALSAIRHALSRRRYVTRALAAREVKPIRLGFSATEDDVQHVLEDFSLRVTNTQGRSFETMATELINEIDLDSVARAALEGGDDIDQQSLAAYREIKQQLVNIGVLEF